MPDHLARLLAETSVVPAVNQIEVHPYFRQSELLAVDAEHGILSQAWSPIGGITFYRDGSHGSTLQDPTIGEIAAAHGKTPAQVMLRWHLQQGRQVIPKSVTPVADRGELRRLRLRAHRRPARRDRRPRHRRPRRPGAGADHPRDLRPRDPRGLRSNSRGAERRYGTPITTSLSRRNPTTIMIVNAYAAPSATEPLVPTTIERRDVGPNDVLIEIKYAGICHSDIHTVRGDWGPITYPQVVGHEIAGVVAEVGSEVTKHQVGDRVGVGCMVNSCRECENCLGRRGAVLPEGQHPAPTTASTVDGTHHPGRLLHARRRRRGLRAAHPRVDPVRRGRAAAVRRHHHVLAARTTGTPAPARRSPSSAWAASATWASRSRTRWAPRSPCCRRRCASRTTGSRSAPTTTTPPATPDTFDELAGTFDLIVNTVSAAARPGRVPAPAAPGRHAGQRRRPGRAARRCTSFSLLSATAARSPARASAASRETQEMLDFCAEHGIGAEIELIGADQINEAYERVLDGDVRYRFVIDTASLV